MYDFVKKTMINKGMELLQSQAVVKLMESEQVGIVIEKAMSVPFKVSSTLMAQRERLVALLDLPTQEDMDDLKRAMTKMEGVLKEIKTESQDLLKKMAEDEPKQTEADK